MAFVRVLRKSQNEYICFTQGRKAQRVYSGLVALWP